MYLIIYLRRGSQYVTFAGLKLTEAHRFLPPESWKRRHPTSPLYSVILSDSMTLALMVKSQSGAASSTPLPSQYLEAETEGSIQGPD